MNQHHLLVRNNCVGSCATANGARTAFNLNVAYVHGVSGNALAIRYHAYSTDAINELYVFLDSHGGTLGNITMEAKIYNESGTATKAGSTLRATSTACTMPDADDKWIKFTFGTPYSPGAIGEILWIVFYNTAADPTTDYPGILTATNTWPVGIAQNISPALQFSTTTGWVSAGTCVCEMPFVLKIGTGYVGQPFTQMTSTYYANDTKERGFVVTPTEDVQGFCICVNTGSSNYSYFSILANTTGPGGAALLSVDLDAANAADSDSAGVVTFSPYTLVGGTTYKCTLRFTAGATSPSVLQIEDYSSYSTVFDALRADDTLVCCWGCIDDGAGGWTEDKSICPCFALGITDNPAQSGGGGLPVLSGSVVR